MHLVFCLYKYFPYGGLQRDFLRIAQCCQEMGANITVYTQSWSGPKPDGFDIKIIETPAWRNHLSYKAFTDVVKKKIDALNPRPYVIGFNKMPHLDAYYAADPCYEYKAHKDKSLLYRLSGRYRHFSAYEKAVFGTESHTKALLISEAEKPHFIQYYQTPESRMVLLPPGISRDRIAPDNHKEIRQAFRAKFNIADDELLLLQIGSGFKTKGLDRTLKAVASLPTQIKSKTKLFVIGKDKMAPFSKQAKSLDIEAQVTHFDGRDDIPRFLLGGDLLIHPAYRENTGTVLLEAVVAGLPVLTTATCGYAHYIESSDTGLVIKSPFNQNELNKALNQMLTDSNAQQQRRANGIQFAKEADLYSLPQRAAKHIVEWAHHARQ